MKLSFKQFSEAYDAADRGEDPSDAIMEGPFWDAVKKKVADIKSAARLSDDEVRKLAKASVGGDAEARRHLMAYADAAKKAKKLTPSQEKLLAAHHAELDAKDAKWRDAASRAEVGQRGSSRAYDRETGSVKRAPKGRDDPWAHVGKHHA